MDVTFTSDPQLAADAVVYAVRAVDFAAKHYKLKLDYREASVEIVETILGKIYNQQLNEKTAFKIGVLFGSYVGELARRHHSAEWGRIQATDGSELPGLRLESGALIWPWAKARNRIMNGPGDNIRAYYHRMMTGEA